MRRGRRRAARLPDVAALGQLAAQEAQQVADAVDDVQRVDLLGEAGLVVDAAVVQLADRGDVVALLDQAVAPAAALPS